MSSFFPLNKKSNAADVASLDDDFLSGHGPTALAANGQEFQTRQIYRRW